MKAIGVPYARGSETSEEAAASVVGAVATLRARVLRALVLRDGTCDELEARLGLTHQTCSARVNELRNRGHIEDTGQRRLTRSGRRAVVWRCTAYGVIEVGA